MQGPRLAIPEREREHAIEPLERAPKAPFDNRRQHHLRIRVPTEATAEPSEVLAKLAEVVDLTVVGDEVAARGRLHGLASLRGEIDNRKAAVAQTHPRLRVHPNVVVVRAA